MPVDTGEPGAESAEDSDSEIDSDSDDEAGFTIHTASDVLYLGGSHDTDDAASGLIIGGRGEKAGARNMEAIFGGGPEEKYEAEPTSPSRSQSPDAGKAAAVPLVVS